jgi:hypothetical protein
MKKTPLKPIFNIGEMINYMANIFELKSSTNNDLDDFSKLHEFATKGFVNFDAGNSPNEILDTYVLLPLEERFSKIYLEQEFKNTMSHYKDIIHEQIDIYLEMGFDYDFSNLSRDHFCIFWSKSVIVQIIPFINERFNSHRIFLNQLGYEPLNIKKLLDCNNAISYFLNWLDTNLGFNHWLKDNQINFKAVSDHIVRWKKGNNIPKRNSIFERSTNVTDTGLCLKEFIESKITISNDHKAKFLLMLEEFFLICRAIDMCMDDVCIAESNIDPNYPDELRFKAIILSVLEDIDHYLNLFKKNMDLFLAIEEKPILYQAKIKLNHLLIESQEAIYDKNITHIENALNQLKNELNKKKDTYYQIIYHYYQALYDVYRFKFKSGIENLYIAYDLSLFTAHPLFRDIFDHLIGLYSIYFLFVSNAKLQKDFIEIRYAGLHEGYDSSYIAPKITEMHYIFRIYMFKLDPYSNDKFLSSSKKRRSKSHVLEDLDIYRYQQIFIKKFKYYKFENKRPYNQQITMLFSHIRNHFEGIIEFNMFDENIKNYFDKSNLNKIILPQKNYTQLLHSLNISDKNTFKKLLDLGADVNMLSSDSDSVLLFSLEKMQNSFGYNHQGQKENFWFDQIKNHPFNVNTLCAITSKRRLTSLGIAINIGKLDIIKQLFKMYSIADSTIEGRDFFANQKFSTDLMSPLYAIICWINSIKNIIKPPLKYDAKNLEALKRYMPDAPTEVLKQHLNMSSNTDFFKTKHHIAKHNTTLTELRKIAVFLLENGADPQLIHNMTNLPKYTPFHMAIESDEKELVELMIEKYHVDYQKRIWIKNEVRGYEKQDNMFLALQWNAKRVLAYFQTLDWHHPPKSPTK